MKRVFVSYSRRNKTFAERIARDLSDAGLDVWVDFRQIQGGELWQNEIYRGIERSEMLVFCLSPDSIASQWCQREANAARDQGKYIIPVMLEKSLDLLGQSNELKWMLDVHIINFTDRYEAAFPELLDALPGLRRVGVYDEVDPAHIPNPFKGLEAFQQTDSHFFFGRERLINKSLGVLREKTRTRFLAMVGASGSGKSSLVRAGIIPKIRAGELPGSDQWPVVIFTPGATPTEALATRLLPLLEDGYSVADITTQLQKEAGELNRLTEAILASAPTNARLLLVVDQFEEVFTRASETERNGFLTILQQAVTVKGGRALVIITMRADFFGNLSQHPELAELFEQENMIIVTEMTTASLLRSIEGPARAVGLIYDDGLTERILEDVRRQPGSLPLLQYALKELYERREGRRLTTEAYEAIGGVQRALAQHAENVYGRLDAAQQAIMRRLLLRLVEVSASGEVSRRRVNRDELRFRDVPDEDIQAVINLATAAESRLLVASREIRPSEDEASEPVIWIDVSHEALIREWDRFKGWVSENIEGLRYGSEIMKLGNDWQRGSRDEAYLLTGTRLTRAEIWLETADATDLQRQFIQASMEYKQKRDQEQQEQQARELELQRRSTNRLRYFVGVLVVSLILAIGLTLVALDSREQAAASANAFATSVVIADRNAAEAERNADEANSLALAASADRSFVDEDTELALALAIEAIKIEEPPPQTQFTLSQVAYAPGARRRFGTEDTQHTDSVNSVAYSPNGQTALSASTDGSLILWDVTTGTALRQFVPESGTDGYVAGINSVAFSPDGAFAVSGAADGSLTIWDVDTGDIVHQLGSGEGSGHTASVHDVAYSPDGRTIVSGSEDKTLILWDAENGVLLRVFSGQDSPVLSVAYSPDGRKMLSGAENGTLFLWDVTTGIVIRSLGQNENGGSSGHSGAVLSVAFSKDGLTALSGSADASVILWDTETGTIVQHFQATTQVAASEGVDLVGAMYSVAFSPDGDTVLAGSANGKLLLWDIETGLETLRLGPGTGVIEGAHRGNIYTAAFSPDGLRILTGGDDGDVILWDIERAEEIWRFPELGSNVQSLAFSSDGRFLVTGSLTSINNPTGDLRLWNAETGYLVHRYVGHKARVNGVAFNPEGTAILSGDNDGTLILWDANTGEQIRQFAKVHTDAINAVAFTPDGQQAISASKDQTLILWDVETGEPVGDPFIGHTKAVYTVAISPDGKYALSGGADKMLLMWDLQGGTEALRMIKHTLSIWSVAFSPDPDMHLALSGSSDGQIILWDVETGAEIKRFSGHRGAVRAVAFNPNSDKVLSGSLDGTIRLWDVDSGFEIRRYEVGGENVGVLSLAASPDGLTTASGLTDKSLRLWRVLPEVSQLLDWTLANRLVPQLDCSMRLQFRVEPACGEDQVVPTRTPYPLPTVTPTRAYGYLKIGGTAIINTTDGDPLNLREKPGLDGRVLVVLEEGTPVTLLDGPTAGDGLVWWKIQTAEGVEGWAVESVENIQTLLPD